MAGRVLFTPWQKSWRTCHIRHWRQYLVGQMITAVTGFLIFLLLLAALAVGLEAQHRHVKQLGPQAPAASADNPFRRLRKRTTRKARSTLD